MNRLDNFPYLIKDWDKYNYETMLQKSFFMNNIDRVKLDLFFIKFRANGNMVKFGPKSPWILNVYTKFLKENLDKDPIFQIILDKFK